MVVLSRSQRSLLSLVLAALFIMPGAASAVTFNVSGSFGPFDATSAPIQNAYAPSEITYTGTITFDTSVIGVESSDVFTFADAVSFAFSLSNGLTLSTLSPLDLVIEQEDPGEFEIGVRGGVPGEVSANGPTSFMVDDFSTPPVTRTFELVSIFFETDDAVMISGTPTLGDIDVAILLVSKLDLFFEQRTGDLSAKTAEQSPMRDLVATSPPPQSPFLCPQRCRCCSARWCSAQRRCAAAPEA